MADTAEKTTDNVTASHVSPEDRAAPTTGGLQVEERTSTPAARGLAEEFRAAGFPGAHGELAVVDFDPNHFEDRAVTWTGSVDNINKNRYGAGAFPYDQRWAWPASPGSRSTPASRAWTF